MYRKEKKKMLIIHYACVKVKYHFLKIKKMKDHNILKPGRLEWNKKIQLELTLTNLTGMLAVKTDVVFRVCSSFFKITVSSQ